MKTHILIAKKFISHSKVSARYYINQCGNTGYSNGIFSCGSMLLYSIETTSYAFYYHLTKPKLKYKTRQRPTSYPKHNKLHNKVSFRCKLLSVNITFEWLFICVNCLVHDGRRTTPWI